MIVRKQERKTTKQQVTWKIQINKIHPNLDHPGGNRILKTSEHLHYITKKKIEVLKGFYMSNINHNFLRKVPEEWEINPGIRSTQTLDKKANLWRLKELDLTPRLQHQENCLYSLIKKTTERKVTPFLKKLQSEGKIPLQFSVSTKTKTRFLDKDCANSVKKLF